jgi:hypothetical protein
MFRSLRAAARLCDSRRRIGRDHALRKKYHSGKQGEDSNQEEKHEHDLKHVTPLLFLKKTGN